MRKILATLALSVLVTAGTPGRAMASPTPPVRLHLLTGGADNSSSFGIWDLVANSPVTTYSGTPHYNVAVLDPDGATAYLLGADQMLPFDMATDTPGSPMTVSGASDIVDAAISPDGSKIYALDDSGETVLIIETASPYAVTPLPLGSVGRGVTLNQSGSRLYVSGDYNLFYVIDTTNNQVITSVSLPDQTANLTMSPDGSEVLAPVLTSNSVERLDTTTNTLLTPLSGPGTSSAAWAGYSPDGKWIYVLGYGGGLGKFDAQNRQAVASMNLTVSDTVRAAFNPNGSKLYAASTDGYVRAVSLDDSTSSAGTEDAPLPLVAGTGPGTIVVGGSMVPAPPAIVTATQGSGQATIAFTEGLTGGDPITGHTATWSGGSQSCPSSPCTVTGVSGTSTSFTLHSTNGWGDSAESAPVVATASGSSASVPDAPTITSAVAGDGQVTLRFRDGSGNGSAITGHFANFAGGPAFCPSSPCVITGLTNGVGYTFTVQAVNAVGNSSPSVASETVMPGRLPEAPKITDLQVTADGVKVVFTPPHSDTPIVKYQSQVDGGAWADLMAATIPGVKPGKHAVKVRGVNGVGAGPASEAAWVTVPGASVKPAAVPAPMVVAAASSARLSWKKSSSEGVTGYTVRADPGPASCTTTAADTDCVIGGTAGKSYTYSVTVRGQGGAVSDPSKWSKSVTLKNPGLPSTLPDDAEPLLTTPKGKITSAVRGQKVTLVGSGFAAYSTVRIVIYGKARQLATVVTDAKGRLNRQITIPGELALGQKHSLMAAGVDPDGATRRISMTVTVKA
ncbi:hypothetical protein [Actinoplanes sp. NPDC051851]|uniref:hypothetical protein n=1 Tax=Actinoplanes sp. NPDC051851 TaxID=3154753 RepID=UPI0034165D5B